MTLAELRAAPARLDHLPGDTAVVLSKDSEGNRYAPLAAAGEGMYWAQTTWSGEHYLTEQDRLAQENPDDWSQAPDDSVRAVFLWPVN